MAESVWTKDEIRCHCKMQTVENKISYKIMPEAPYLWGLFVIPHKSVNFI